MTETQEHEQTQVHDWRKDWLIHGGWTADNAEMLADLDIDYRYANKVLDDCKHKGLTEEFALNLII